MGACPRGNHSRRHSGFEAAAASRRRASTAARGNENQVRVERQPVNLASHKAHWCQVAHRNSSITFKPLLRAAEGGVISGIDGSMHSRLGCRQGGARARVSRTCGKMALAGIWQPASAPAGISGSCFVLLRCNRGRMGCVEGATAQRNTSHPKQTGAETRLLPCPARPATAPSSALRPPRGS